MANCTNCGCNQIDCGCKDKYLTTPPPCPTPADCPEAQPCSEVFDSQCIIYTAPNIICATDIVVAPDTNVQTALQDIVEYFCLRTTIPKLECETQTVVTDNSSVISAFTQVVDYVCANIIVAQDITCNEDVVIPEGDTVISGLSAITDYFCDLVNSLPAKYSNSQLIPAATPTTITHNLNTTSVIVAVATSGGLPYNPLVHGTDYTYQIQDSNNIVLTYPTGGSLQITVIG
jgi:hypothetical protein